MKDVIKLICHLPPTSCELSAFKNCVIRNAVGEEKLSKASLADVLFEVELTAFKLQSVLQHRSHHMLSACKLCQRFTVNSPTDQLADTNSPTYKIE